MTWCWIARCKSPRPHLYLRCRFASCSRPMFLLSGVARYLFLPLAEAVVFAMLASYILSRTIVPTMAKYLLRHHRENREAASSRNPFVRFQQSFEAGFEKLRATYHTSSGEGPPSSAAVSRSILCGLPWIAGDTVAVAGPGLLPTRRRRQLQVASSRTDGHAH